MPGRVPEKFLETLILISRILNRRKYAFRGTTSLILQGLDMISKDIDILCDKDTALASNFLLQDFLEEEVSLKKSQQFKSYFGKFIINKIPVEMYGEWQIKDTKGNWSQPFTAVNRHRIKYQNKQFFVTDIEDELMVFALMGRWNAFRKIKRELKKSAASGQEKLL
ncbi:MAG TPA: hypothetical protein VJC17_04105 [Candidatus Dojkabacteria bacterium]|nr:hypothetical protein [Candidatus Dojkabacteria bacterium]